MGSDPKPFNPDDLKQAYIDEHGCNCIEGTPGSLMDLVAGTGAVKGAYTVCIDL